MLRSARVSRCQEASVTWGDGTADTAFDEFSDAFGGVLGRLRHSHVYPVAGTYVAILDLADDDGGQVQATLTLQVLSPVQALTAIVSLLEETIAAATEPSARRSLELARQSIVGADPDGVSGALPDLYRGHTAAAVAKLSTAVGHLNRAGGETGVTVLVNLLQEVIASLF